MSNLEKPIPEPIFIPNEIGKFIANHPFIPCDTKKWYEKHNTDCYFYSEEQDMHARIPCCDYHGYFYEDFGCGGCHAYIPNKTVFKYIKSLVDNGEFDKMEEEK